MTTLVTSPSLSPSPSPSRCWFSPQKLPFRSPSRPRPILAAMATDPSSADQRHIVVCGGGVIGACCAYFLARDSAGSATRVTLVEKSSVACAASGKAGGFLALDWCDSSPLSPLARHSFHLHRSLSHLLDGPRSYGYRPLHTLSLSLLPQSPSSASATSSPLLPDWVDGPAARPKTIGTPDTTAQVHPHLFTKTLLSAAVADHGAELIIGELDRVELADGKATGVRLKSGRLLPADDVILALGPWSSRSAILRSLFAVSGLKAHSVVLRPKDPAAITPHALFLSYQPSPSAKLLDPEVYPRPTGEVYICGMTKEAEVPDDPDQIAGEPESIAMLHRIAGAVSSRLRGGEADVVAEQACFLPCTEDGLPVIGEVPGAERCFVATGHSCWGILNGPATGACMAELVLKGKSTAVDLAPFTPSRFLKKPTF